MFKSIAIYTQKSFETFHSIDRPEARKGFNMNNPEQAAGAARGIVAYSSELRNSSTFTDLTNSSPSKLLCSNKLFDRFARTKVKF
jgi:hypothetical protein